MRTVFNDAVDKNSNYRKYNIKIETIEGKDVQARFETCDQIGVLVVLNSDIKPEDSNKPEYQMFYPWSQIKSIRL